MSRVALALLVFAAGGCGRSTPDLSLAIRLPGDRHLFAAVATLNLSATRDGQVLAQAAYSANASYVSVSGVTKGAGTIVTLEGVAASGDVLARGSSCPVSFEKGGMPVPLYFAPTNFFAPTVGAPLTTRSDPIVVPLSDGTVLLAGGADGGVARKDAELFSPGPATFAANGAMLTDARSDAEVALVPSGGAVITGGLDDAGMPLAEHEIYDEAGQQFVPFASPLIDARVGHRAVVLADGRVLVTGGRSATEAALATTAFVRTETGGAAQVTAGPSLLTPRREHAAVLASGDTAVVIGGFAADGSPLATFEALTRDSPPAWKQIASLQFPRAQATASILPDGEILIVGGAGDAAGTPRADAELYNPFLGTTTILSLRPRRAHTATVFADGRVLITGGIGPDGQPLSSVELFIPETATTPAGFVPERPLATARSGHVAAALCDGTVLIVGGAPTAEIYNPPVAF